MTQAPPSSNNTGHESVEQPLFRPEVLSEQRSQWLGKVLLAPSVSHRLFTAFAMLSGTAIVLLLFFGDYTRKEKVAGWLVPQQGLVHIYTPQSGVVTQLNVDVGTVVVAGQALLTVSSERQSEALGATQQEVVRRLQSRRESLQAETAINVQIFEQELRDLDRQVVEAAQEIALREEELRVQRERVALAESSALRMDKGRRGGVVSQDSWLSSEDLRLEQLMIQRGLERDLAATERKKLSLEARIRSLPLELEKSRSSLQRQIDSLDQELAEVEARRQLVLTAPQSGVVTNLQLEQGNSVQPAVSLLSILPEGSELEARLSIPTRAIGFVEPGQTVQLRYKAFPYQKFGHYQGSISSVSRSTVKRSDTPFQVSASGQSVLGNEPVYLITVTLERQSIEAYGKAIALQPGMEFEADILLENRRLIEWVLEPLYTMTGRAGA